MDCSLQSRNTGTSGGLVVGHMTIFKAFLNWNIIDLQYHVSFRCPAQQFSFYVYYVYIMYILYIYIKYGRGASLVAQFSSVQFSCSVMSDCLQPKGLQHAKPPCPSPTPGVHPNLCPLSQWCHPTISSSVVSFSSRLQSFPASGSFPMSQLFASGGQSIGVSASASVFPMNIQGWFPLEWTVWISLKSKGLSGVFSKTTVQKHQFFCAQLWLRDEKSACNAGDTGDLGLIPGWEEPLEEEMATHSSILARKIPWDRGA